jgi:hypothetical protein
MQEARLHSTTIGARRPRVASPPRRCRLFAPTLFVGPSASANRRQPRGAPPAKACALEPTWRGG